MTNPARRPGTGPVRTTSVRSHRTGVIRTGNIRPSTGAARSTPIRPDLWLVPAGEPARRPRSSRRRRAPFVLLVVGLLVSTTLGLLFLNTAIAVDSLKATQLRTENAQRVEHVQRLERQVVDGSTPAEVAQEAADAGLVPAGPPAYLVLEPDGSSTVRGEPQPAADPAAPDPDEGN
ncbi:hypothetical protein [Geodermatophilus sp. URMC 64]